MFLFKKPFFVKSTPPSEPIEKLTPVEQEFQHQVQEYDWFDKKLFYNTLLFERKYTLSMLWFFVLTFIVAIIISTLIYTNIINFTSSYTLAVFLNIYNVVSFLFILSNSLNFKLINNQYKIWNQSLLENQDISSEKSAIFFKKYLTLNKLLVHVLWINIFIITFYGLFILIVYLLRNVDTTWGSPQGNFHLRFNLKQGLFNAFGDVSTFSLINLIILSSIVFASAISFIFVKYRINCISACFKNKLFYFEEHVKQSTSQLKKYWFYFYLFMLLFVIFIPLTLLVYRVIKKIFNRKSSSQSS
ncbi:MSC_0882 family membrane protein [Mycoplasma sp. 3686d]|uniref:MSC_0882 family membrane protein n=1 Tax=Mycoplasma sp. 3686d TaxID=2967300 RepID=UPI00211C236C|nr:hypothetical protein [Mycoplasma sp. 3686d]UUM24544.1 hypothetical protein NPA12_02480 [Mycoplasma sp. 3686d]